MESEQRRMLLAPDRDEDDNVEHLEGLATNGSDEEVARELKRRLWWRNATINSVFIAMWFGFSTLLSMYNKWMFSPTYYNFPFPLFVTATHMMAQFVLSSAFRSIWPEVFKPPGHPTAKEYVQKCVPCAVTTGLDIGLSNLSLKTITLSLYTMCKSSSLIFVLTFAFVFKLERFSIRLVSVILLIASGVLLMVLSTDVEGHGGPPPGDSSLSHALRAVMTSTTAPLAVGIILVFMASAFGGLRWALTQLLLTGAHGPPQVASSRASSSSIDSHPERPHSMGLANPAATIFFLSPSMFITLLVVSAYVEGPLPSKLAESGFFDSFAIGIKTAGYILFPGTIAFAMVMSEYYIIQRTGIVPMSIAGIFKEVTTVLLATLFFHDDMTLVNWIGLFITICGIATFTHHKYQKAVSDSAEFEQDASQGGEIALPDCYEAIPDNEERDQAASGTRQRTSDDLQWPHPPMAWRSASLDSNESASKISQPLQNAQPNLLHDKVEDEKHTTSGSGDVGIPSQSPTPSHDRNIWSGSPSSSSSRPKRDKDSSRRVRFSVAGAEDILPTGEDSSNLFGGSSSPSRKTPPGGRS